MPKFPVKISKLVLESDTQSAAGDAFVAGDERERRDRLGVIFGIIELFGLSEEVAEKIFEIMADLETEYYLPPFELEEGIEKRFEECLQRANRRIYKIIKDSTVKIELKNINVLVGLIHLGRIHLSQIGKINVFLFHQRRKYDYAIIDILGQTTERKQKIDPEKMFSNIISGAITIRDNLLFGNDSILEYLSQNNLLEIVSENTALAAIQQIEQILTNQSQTDNFYAIIIQPEVIAEPLVSKSMAAAAAEETPPPQNSINKLIVTQKKTEEFLTPSMMPNWKKFLIIILNACKKAGEFLAKEIKKLAVKTVKEVKKLINLAGQKITNWLQSRIGARPRAEPEETNQQEVWAKNFKRKSWQIAQKFTKKTINFESYRKLLPQKGSGGTIPPHQPGEETGFSQKLSDYLNRQIARFVALKKSRQILLIAAFILIFLFSQSIVWRGQSDTLKNTSAIQETISQIKEKLDTAEAQNVFNDETGAKKSLAEAKALLAQIPNQRKYKKIREETESKINNLTQTLQKITYLDNPLVIADPSSQNQAATTAGLAKAGNLLLSFDNQNQTLYKIDLEKKQILPIKLGLRDVKKIIDIDEKNILLLSGDNNFYRYNLTSTSTNSSLALKANSRITDFELYGGKLYTLQTDKGQIFKHFPSGGGFNSGSAWLKAGASASGATTLAIDGGIYLIKENNEINYFLSGKVKDIKFSAVDPAIKSPRQAYTDADSNYLYILDQQNKRIVVYDKNGNLKTQITSKNFGDLKSLVVVEKEKKIYLLSDNKVLELPINF